MGAAGWVGGALGILRAFGGACLFGDFRFCGAVFDVGWRISGESFSALCGASADANLPAISGECGADGDE